MDWTTCLAFSRDVGEVMTRSNPDLYTTTFRKQGRERRILIDYLRNNRTNTSICAYSPRARAQAPVSVPLDWKELNARPDRWTLRSVARRLARLHADPWASYWTTPQRVAATSLHALKDL
jgi:bifunctional non-homologous end joining protein LigD